MLMPMLATDSGVLTLTDRDRGSQDTVSFRPQVQSRVTDPVNLNLFRPMSRVTSRGELRSGASQNTKTLRKIARNFDFFPEFSLSGLQMPQFGRFPSESVIPDPLGPSECHETCIYTVNLCPMNFGPWSQPPMNFVPGGELRSQVTPRELVVETGQYSKRAANRLTLAIPFRVLIVCAGGFGSRRDAQARVSYMPRHVNCLLQGGLVARVGLRVFARASLLC
ncbi:hypothetical protein DENSPDRAFT_443746 [Dentipellis sp. KUC8613]|nr:hypothetical protein DENSPDRAFT_443746 [Dentipellis sp. KUC8613]